MRLRKVTVLGATASCLSLGLAAPAFAGHGEDAHTGPLHFDGLASSYTCTVSGGKGEKAFVLPNGYQQTVIAREGDPGFQDLPDMNTLNETGPQAGRYLYRAHEVGANASVSVTDLSTGANRLLTQRQDYQRFDGIVWTPWQTLLVTEEVNPSTTNPAYDPDVPHATAGLVYEVDPVTGETVARPALGTMSHEGIRLDRHGNVYGISERSPGFIYKFTPDVKGDLSSGDLYALKIVEGDKNRGTFEWVLLTPHATARHAVQVWADPVAEQAEATAFSRPEDVEISTSTGNSKGGQLMYVAVTGEDAVYAMDLNSMKFATFLKDGVTPGTGPAGDAAQEFDMPDNLALDKAGNLYVTEDPGSSLAKGKRTGDDIWVGVPSAGDPLVAESAARFASLTDCDAEPTGIYFDRSGQILYVNAMHRGGDDVDYAMAITRERR